MRQDDAVQSITTSLQSDPRVKAIFLKGSMGRGEEDEHSDVDLYCLVDECDQESFLHARKQHLEKYRDIIFYDDIFIIAPQIIVVYDNLLHLDLFTVTEQTLIHKDYFKVLYDPEKRMEVFEPDQNLRLDDKDFLDAVDDVAFFLLQYKKAADRGNDIWAVKVIHDIAINLAKILLKRYKPERAQLGLKAVDSSLPLEVSRQFMGFYQQNSLHTHQKSIQMMIKILDEHLDWVVIELNHTEYTVSFLQRMMNEFHT